jgi:hypothetical protein
LFESVRGRERETKRGVERESERKGGEREKGGKEVKRERGEEWGIEREGDTK